MKNSNVVALGNDQRDQLKQRCRRAIDRLDRMQVEAIDSITVAIQVATQLNRGKNTPDLLLCAAIEGIAQIAREELRGRHGMPDDDEVSEEQLDAFAENLNERYSIKRPGWDGPKYVQREKISKEEFEKQVLSRLAKLAKTYSRHHDIAKAWNDSRP